MAAVMGSSGGGGVAASQGALVNRSGSGQFAGTGELTDKQRRFVRFYVHNGGHAAAAAESAGYENPAQSAHQILRSKRVQAGVKREREKFIDGDLANAAACCIRDLITDKDTPANVRFQASKWALEAAGHSTKGADAAADGGDKSLNEMTIDELQAFINGGQQAIADKRDQEARTIDVQPGSAQVSAQDGADESIF